MIVWAPLILAMAGFVAFIVMTLDDARRAGRRFRAPVAWVYVAAGATAAAGLVHLLLTPAHWRQATVFGIFFLVAGIAQLALASLATGSRREPPPCLLVGASNCALVAIYVATRVIPPPTATRPEPVDAVGLATVAVELIAVAACIVTARQMSRVASRIARRAPSPRLSPEVVPPLSESSLIG